MRVNSTGIFMATSMKSDGEGQEYIKIKSIVPSHDRMVSLHSISYAIFHLAKHIMTRFSITVSHPLEN